MTNVQTALAPVRELLQLDGADIEVERYVDGVASLRLILDGASCRECVLPRERLEATVAAVLQENLPDLNRVEIDDPREAGSDRTLAGGAR